MKKLLLVLSLFLLLTGCKSKNIDLSLNEIMDKVYEGYNDELILERTEINNENIERFLGTKDIEYTEALASEPIIGSIAHSAVLIRVKDESKINEVKELIKKSVNPRKWVCVWVEDDEVKILNKGNLILLVMVKDNPDILVNNFNNIK